MKLKGYFIFISGSPGISAIGRFLMQNKDFFIEHYVFTIKRIGAHETSKYPMYKTFPALKMNGQVYYGNEILNVLSVGLNKNNREEEDETYEEYMIRATTFERKGDGTVVFPGDAEEETAEQRQNDLAKKMQAFGKKTATTAGKRLNERVIEHRQEQEKDLEDEEDFNELWKRSITG